MSYSANLNINIPTTHYVGFQKRSETLPLGFMTPDGTDKAAMKRKSTVDSWAKGYGQTKSLPAKSMENKPMTGFKFGRNISGGGSGWNSRHDKWRVQDPRGFELEITSGNLEVIMRACTVEKGEVLEQCIWARLGSDNILLPLDTEEYRKATANTQRLGSKGSVRDIVPGSKMVFKNGHKATFVGRIFLFGYNYRTRNEGNTRNYWDGYYTYTREPEYKVLNDKALFAYLDQNGRLVARSSLNIATIDNSDEKTATEMLELANDKLLNSDNNIDLTDTWSDYRILQLLDSNVAPAGFTAQRKLVLIGDFNQAEADFKKKYNYCHRHVLVQHPSGLWGFGYMSSSYKFANFVPQELDESALINDGRIIRRWKAAQRTYWGTSGRPDSVNLDMTGIKETDIQCYNLMLEYTNYLGKVSQVRLTEDYE